MLYGSWPEHVKHFVPENGAAGQRPQCGGTARRSPGRGQVAPTAGVLDQAVGPVGVRTAQPGPVPDVH